ncbi:L,D-transpeptidase family protein [Paenibacillus sp. HW567]|uniref:L,D-transpeptidase family protein n=1 Tax=Paenibacillus sp. HW567 TaxID=1034769 RepID=UPI0003740FA6|nr:L,D-transpeptidase [Paenibacillus sp. HW567]
MGYHIMIALKTDRKQFGSLKMYNDSGALVFGPKQCLARSEFNTAWNVINGCTPTGVYTATIEGPMSPTTDNIRSYGKQKYVVMDPVSGDALTAKQMGRSGLWIHGGAAADPGAINYPLRPTHGCVRLSEDDQASLIYVLSTLGGGTGKVTITES